MYKLTYETDEEILDENISKPALKIPEIDVTAQDGPTAETKKERTSRLPSTSSAAFVRRHIREKSTSENKTNRNFYSIFANPPKSSPKKSSEACKNCEGCFLLLYLIALTAAVVVLFISLKHFEEENFILKNRLKALESGQTLSLFQGEGRAHAENETENRTQPSQCGCARVWKDSRELRSKLSRLSDLVGNLQLISNENLVSTEKRFREVRRRFNNLSRDVSNVMKQESPELPPPGLFPTPEKEELLLLEQLAARRQDSSMKKTVAFQAFRAANNEMFVDRDRELNVRSNAETQGIAISYSYEMINERRDMRKSTGIFTAPYDGTYAFFVSFCTQRALAENVLVQLAKNSEAIRSFRVPFSTGQRTAFGIFAQGRALPLAESAQTSKPGGILKHRQQMIARLQQGDSLQLTLARGAIVELDCRRESECEYCTEFSGFLIN